MKRCSFLVLTALVIIIVAASGFAQDGRIVAPPSTLDRTPGRVHTPLLIYYPDGIQPANSPPPGAETPASIACIYGVVAPTSGCPMSGSLVPTGGAKAIAVVDYGLSTTMQSDFNAFNTQYGLPAQTVTVLCYPSPPCANNNGTGWDLETALDIEYAHAMAPHAQIIIASFTGDPIGDGAEAGAAAAVAAAGGGEVSNSWTYNGGENWCGSGNCELGYDGTFVKAGVVFFASAGDNGAQVNYPSVSPNVISAGGTHINRSGGNFTGTEACWGGSGGGISVYEPRPSYQTIVENIVHTWRGIPDLSADADPNTGVAVYSSTYCGGWCQVGGTSVSSPVLAGITNAVAGFKTSTNAELTKTYLEYTLPGIYHTDFFDVVTGSNGFSAVFGWDRCTGIGSPRKPYAGL